MSRTPKSINRTRVPAGRPSRRDAGRHRDLRRASEQCGGFVVAALPLAAVLRRPDHSAVSGRGARCLLHPAWPGQCDLLLCIGPRGEVQRYSSRRAVRRIRGDRRRAGDRRRRLRHRHADCRHVGRVVLGGLALSHFRLCGDPAPPDGNRARDAAARGRNSRRCRCGAASTPNSFGWRVSARPMAEPPLFRRRRSTPKSQAGSAHTARR